MITVPLYGMPKILKCSAASGVKRVTSRVTVGGGVWWVEGHTLTVLLKATKLVPPIGHISLKRRGARSLPYCPIMATVCVHVNGTWYHKTTTIGFDDGIGNLFTSEATLLLAGILK